MTVYEVFVHEDEQPSCPRPNPCCEEPCDEPSFWKLLPCRRLNWIALGLAAFAIGFGLIGLGYINIGTTIGLATFFEGETPPFFDTTLLIQGTRLIAIFLAIALVSAWLLFKACSDDWKTVVVGSLIGASGLPLAAIGLLYFTVAQFTNPPFNDPTSDHTWFNIALSLIIASIVGFLLLAYFIYFNHCLGCITAKRGVVVSLIFLSGGWAAWSLGRLLQVAVTTFQLSFSAPSQYTFPSFAFMAAIAVSIVNIVLVVALGWYVLTCSVDNCFTAFLPLFASAGSLGNWALYRVGLNVLSYVSYITGVSFPPATVALLPMFAYTIGFISITALLLTFVIAIGKGDGVVVFAASAISLLYAIATYTYVATAFNLVFIEDGFVTFMLQGIILGITLTAILAFILTFKARCPIPKIIYGLAAGTFGWAVIYLYSTFSADTLGSMSYVATFTTLNIGLVVIISAAIFAVLYAQFIACDELLSAITFLNIALLIVGAAGFIGTIAYFQAGVFESSFPLINPLNTADIRAATIIYILYVLLALFLPRLFAKCSGIKRHVVIAIASLGFGIAAVDLGRAIAFARVFAFAPPNIGRLNFSPLMYIASAIGAVLAGQAVVWSYPQANVCTALIASTTGLIVEGIALQVIIFVHVFVFGNASMTTPKFELIGLPWLIFTLVLVALLVSLEFKSLCIPQHCRFLVGLLIPVLGIAVFGKFAGASAALGTAFNNNFDGAISFLTTFSYTTRLILVNSIIPLTGFILSLQAFNCTSCLSYLPSTIPFIAVVYVTSQFKLLKTFQASIPQAITISPPLPNLITAVYLYFSLSNTNPTQVASNATFITQVSLVYILFLAPALIAGFVFSCSRRVSAAILGSTIAATVISFGAFGAANAIVGVIIGIASSGFSGIITGAITANISFAQFLQGINSQLILLAVGVLTALFIYFDKCRYPSC